MGFDKGIENLNKAVDALPEEDQIRIGDNAAAPPVIYGKDRKPVFIPKVYGALELLCLDLPPKRWIIPGVLPVGVTHFAGKEKNFKSYAVMGLCQAVSRGDPYLGMETNKCQSLYFDLESNEERPQARIKQIFDAYPVNSNDFKIITQNNMETPGGDPVTLENGFDDTLSALLDIYPEVRLVVIDVFGRIRSKKGSDDYYTWDYKDVRRLQKIANKFDVAIILVNHVIKNAEKVYMDDFDSARGSGINAAADCIWILKADPNSGRSGTLKIKGRDVAGQELHIQFDDKAFVWRQSLTREEEEKQLLRSAYLKTNILQTLQAVTKFSVTWKGQLSELIKDSYKTNTPIGAKPKQLGMDLRKYEALLREDGFTFVRDSSNKAYTFTNNNNAYKKE